MKPATLLLSLALCTPLAAQRGEHVPEHLPEAGAEPVAPSANVLANIGGPLQHVYFDDPGEGELWARGTHWKMSFGVDGAVYHAAFSRSLPSVALDLSADSVTVGGEMLVTQDAGVRRDGERVELDRGSFLETYSVELDSVEQRFVFGTLPTRDELVVRIELPEVRSVDLSNDGLVLHTDVGAVNYSRAFAFDASGLRVDVPTTFEDGAIVLRVDAGFVAAAKMPLVIDPYITHTWLDISSTDARNPDVVYDTQNGRWMATFEESFAGSDLDIRVQAVDFDGFVTHDGYIDVSTTTWAKPRIAYLNADARCMVVCEVGATLSRIVRGRTVKIFNSNTLIFGFNLTISSAVSGEKFAPTIGGDTHAIQPAYFCIAFQRENLNVIPEFEIQYVLVDSTSQIALGPVPIPSAGSLADTQPSLSRTNRGNRWTLAFQRSDPVTFGDILATYIDWNGALSPIFGISAFNIARDFKPSASSPLVDSTRSAVAFERRVGFSTQFDVWVVAIQDGVALESVNVSVLENSGTQLLSQTEPSIDSDGRHFMLAYAEAFSSNPDFYAVRATDIALSGNKMTAVQAHNEVLAFATVQRVPKVAAARVNADGPNRFMVAFHVRFTDTDYDIAGVQWSSLQGGTWSSFCFGDGTGAACPCANTGAPGNGCGNSQSAAGARLEVESGVLAPLADTAVLRASGIPAGQPCLFFQGAAELAGAPFGEGLRCAGGAVARIGVKSAVGGVATYPGPGDLNIAAKGFVPDAGGPRSYQVWYRDPSPFCGTSNFNLTNGVRILWSY